MKKFFKFACLSAVVLAGVVGFTGCSSEQNVYEPEMNGETVKTQFTITFPQNVVDSRTTAAVVQDAQTIASFRGMDNMVLIPFGKTSALTGGETKIGNRISLTSMIAPSTQTVSNAIPANTLTANSNSVLYNDVTIPLGTATFLFYGKAIDNAANTAITTVADKFKFGTLTPSGLASDAAGQAEPASIEFAPVAISSASTASTIDTKAQAIVDYLTVIANAQASASDTWAVPAVAPALADLYNKFIMLKAGASDEVEAVLEDLYNSLQSNTTDLSLAIQAAILTKATVSSGVLTLDSSVDGYPQNLNLPDGAAAITWDDTNKKFVVVAQNAPTAQSSQMNVASLDRYVYPANLYYRANSTVKVSNSSRRADYDGTNTWAQILAKYEAGTAVTSTTQSVAIVDPIQYAVGRLDMTVSTSTETGHTGELPDGSYENELPDGTMEKVYVTIPSGGFEVTGILIGGQRKVDWQFLPDATDTNLFTIYDNIELSQGAAMHTDDNNVNYTMALETPVGENVYVALELRNNSGEDFVGLNHEVIPAGCKFYMVGQLNLTTATAAAVNSGIDINQVFKQDYKTLVNFTISDLGKATYTVPDLRSPKLELGLSVDLVWQQGLTFDVEF